MTLVSEHIHTSPLTHTHTHTQADNFLPHPTYFLDTEDGKYLVKI